jgi:hypothetical protein
VSIADRASVLGPKKITLTSETEMRSCGLESAT